jgi:hypothetical protein
MKKALIMMTALLLVAVLTGCPSSKPDPDPDPDPDPETGNTIKIMNQSGKALYSLYASTDPENDWGEDHLGGIPLAHGQSFLITELPDGKYRLLAGANNGEYAMYPSNDRYNNHGERATLVSLVGGQNAVWTIDHIGLQPNEGEGTIAYSKFAPLTGLAGASRYDPTASEFDQ